MCQFRDKFRFFRMVEHVLQVTSDYEKQLAGSGSYFAPRHIGPINVHSIPKFSTRISKAICYINLNQCSAFVNIPWYTYW